MAKIPTGNFGTVLPQATRTATVNTDGGVNQALQGLAQTGMDLAQQYQRVEEQQQRMAAVSSMAGLNNDLHDARDALDRDLQAGTIKPEDAMSEWQKRAAEAKKGRLDGLSQYQIDVIEPQFVATTGALGRTVQGAAIKRTQQNIGADILTTGEALQRDAMRDLPGAIGQYHKIVDSMGPQAGWSPEQIAKAKQGFTELTSFNVGNAAIEGAAQTGDITKVRAVRERLQGPEGEAIDPAKRTALITKAYAYENGIEAQAQRDRDRAQREQDGLENKSVDTYNKYFDLVSQGRFLSADAVNDLVTSTTGTRMAGPVQELVKSQAKVAGFASLPLQQQAATLERMRAAGSDPSIGVSPEEQKVQEQFQRIYDAGTKAYAENSWQAAQERGVIKDAPTIQLNDVQTAQQVLAQRMKVIGQVEIAAGRKVSPLQPQEADQIARLIKALPPDQQSGALASLGTIIGDADRVAALAKQMHDKDQTLGLAMILAGDRTTQGRYSSELLLRGDRAIKDKAIMIDATKETGWRGAIANIVGDAFPNQEVRQQVINSAYLINAGIVADGGSSDPARALRLTVGSIVDHNGSKIPLPRGMEEKDFDKRLSSITPADIASQSTDQRVYVGGTSIPAADFVKQLPNAQLISAGPGRYNVKAGGTLATNSQGQRITIRIAP
jgi:hypothetical protein